MNTATLTATAARFHIALPSGLLRLLPGALAAPAAHRLQAQATLWIAQPLGRTVTCETGTLWLIFDNEPRDVILEAGQSHQCVKASKLAIHALVSSRLSVA
jgi:hypothetical protein